jgi:hypothetical protein
MWSFLAVTGLGCAVEPEGALVRIEGIGPADMDIVVLRALRADADPVVIHTWSIGIDDRGRFDLTTHIDPAICPNLAVQGHWCKCGLLGDGIVHDTQLLTLGRCGDHTGLVLRRSGGSPFLASRAAR